MKFDLTQPVNVDGIVFQGSFDMTDPYFSARIQEEVEKQESEDDEESNVRTRAEAANAPSDSGRSKTESRSPAK